MQASSRPTTPTRDGRSATAGAPLIGISTSELRVPAQVKSAAEADPPRHELALGLTYPEAVERAGGLPVIIPPWVAGIDALLGRLDGLLLSGGPDLHPSAYGQEPDPSLGPTERKLDEFELELTRRADELQLPILGLCRGQQVLNVVRGGSLIQDLPTSDRVRHRQDAPGASATHLVTIEAGSRLAAIFGAGEHAVNSFHHQAVDELGRGLRATAHSSDGVIEAIEAVDRAFVLGVQWHAESLASEPDQGDLFRCFVEACLSGAPARPVAA
jgi:putative glutamine amidotransferase